MMGLSKPTMRRIHGMMFKLPLMITCETFEDFILAYLENDLTSQQKFVFEMHLKICAECQEYLRAYKATMNLTKSADFSDDVSLEDVPEDLIKAVIEARKE